ncbi:hypothetical protein [Lysobacter gummosus]
MRCEFACISRLIAMCDRSCEARCAPVCATARFAAMGRCSEFE